MSWRFGDCELDRGTRELRRAGTVVELTPKAYQLLELLLERRPDAVSRQEIRDALWPETAVSDSNLATLVWEVRRAIGDGEEKPLIRTLRGFGYAFAGPADLLPPKQAAVDRDLAPAPASPRRRFRRAHLLSAAAACALMVGGYVWLRHAGNGATPIRSLVVIPFTNLAKDPADRYLVEGVHEALIADLARIPELKVISRTSAMHYGGTDLSAPEIAAELGVDALVEGSVLRVGERVRITAQLIRGAEDEHVWANRYDRDLEDTLTVLGEVARTIAGELAIAVERSTAEHLERERTVPTAAFEAYLKGRHALNEGTARSVRESLQHFDEAIETDPSFALAHAGKATAHFYLGYSWGEPTLEAARRIEAAARQALALDPGLSEPYAVLGWSKLCFEWDWPEAEAAFRKAIQLSPSDPAAQHGLGDLQLIVGGDAEAALRGAELAARLDPMNAMWVAGVVGHRFIAGDYEGAVAKGEALLKLFPEHPEGRLLLVEALWHTGLQAEALEHQRRAADPRLVQALERGAASGGPRGAQRAMAQELERRWDSGQGGRAFTIASLYARAGDAEEALRWLERAGDQRDPWFFFVRSWPDFAELRSDPRFEAFTKRAGFPEVPPPAD